MLTREVGQGHVEGIEKHSASILEKLGVMFPVYLLILCIALHMLMVDDTLVEKGLKC